jgi:O-antigen biosynthesis protein
MPLISVVIVSYRVPTYLHQTLRSLAEAELYDRCEVVIVDNASGDESRELIARDFPAVVWVQLKENIGFGRACNVGVQASRGQYVLLLNPDMLVSKDSLRICQEYLEAHPDVGIVGPKMLRPDGSFQPHCRRSFPTPANAFYYMSGLSRLFPRSARFGAYNFTHMSPDVSMAVDAVSGSFMLLRRGLFQEVHGFDESFFMYAEDLDLCARVKAKGLKVWYLPTTQVIHFKGKSSSRHPIRTRVAFYETMIMFSRKYRRTYGGYLPNWVVVIGILLLGGVNVAASLLRSLTACFIDLVLINVTLWGAIYLRFALVSRAVPYGRSGLWSMVAMHLLLSSIFVLSLWYRGIYSKGRYSVKNAVLGGLAASVIFMTCVYFVQTMAFSRIAFAIASLLITLLLVAWREMLPRATQGIRRLMFATGRVIILGNGAIAESLIKNVEADGSARISGIVWPSAEEMPGEFQGYPVLGPIEQIQPILGQHHADVLLIATAIPWYSHIIEALASMGLRNLTIKWVPPDLLANRPEDLPKIIPLHDFTV